MSLQQDLSLASIGTGVIFYYYNSNDILSFLLQKRSQNVMKHKGKIGTIGGYSHNTINGTQFESAEDALWREIKEEAGREFRNTLSPKDFTLNNVAKIRPNIELSSNGKERINYHFIWAREISEESAMLAHPADKYEVDAICYLTQLELYNEIETDMTVPWFKSVLSELQSTPVIPYC
jgi:hypothetical protein